MEKWYKKSRFRSIVDMHIPSGEGNLEAFDAEKYADCMKAAGVETSYVAASNCLGLSLFPSEVGYRHSITYKRDIFGETVAALRARGIGVVAYINSWCTEGARRHPEWQIRQHDGYIRGNTSRFGTCCLNSPYRDYFHAFVDEIVSKYDIDGLWVDMIGFYSADCVCDSCRKKYFDLTGNSIPTTIDWTNENYVRYVKFKYDTVTEYVQGIREAVLRAKPNISLAFQSAGWATSPGVGVGNGYFSCMDYASGDFYGDRNRTDVICRLLPNLSENSPFEYMISRAPDLSYHTAIKDKNEIMLQAYTAFMCGGSFMFIDAINPDGTMNYDFYKFMGEIKKELEPFLKTVDFENRALRDVAVYVNFDSYTSRAAEGKPTNQEKNFYSIRERLENINKAFSRAHIDYDVLTEKNIGELGRYKVIVVPDLYRMKQSECEALRTFVREGGRLYVSGSSTALSTDGKNKNSFMLSDVMGVEYGNFEDISPVYLAPTCDGQPYFGHFSEKYPAMLPFAVPVVRKVSDDAKVLANLTYPYTDSRNIHRFSSAISNPPSRKTDIPAIVYNSFGKGACLYTCAPFENSTVVCNYDIFSALIKALADDAGGLTLECDECEYLEHALRHDEGEKRYSLSLLNYQNIKKIVPLYNVEIALSLDILPKNVYSVLSRAVSFEKRGEKLVVTLEKLDVYDVIYIEY